MQKPCGCNPAWTAIQRVKSTASEKHKQGTLHSEFRVNLQGVFTFHALSGLVSSGAESRHEVGLEASFERSEGTARTTPVGISERGPRSHSY